MITRQRERAAFDRFLIPTRAGPELDRAALHVPFESPA